MANAEAGLVAVDATVFAWARAMRLDLEGDGGWRARAFSLFERSKAQRDQLLTTMCAVFGDTVSGELERLVELFVDDLERRTAVCVTHVFGGVEVVPRISMQKYLNDSHRVTICLDVLCNVRGDRDGLKRIQTWFKRVRTDAREFRSRLVADLYAWLLWREDPSAPIFGSQLDDVVTVWTLPLQRMYMEARRRMKGPYTQFAVATARPSFDPLCGFVAVPEDSLSDEVLPAGGAQEPVQEPVFSEAAVAAAMNDVIDMDEDDDEDVPGLIIID